EAAMIVPYKAYEAADRWVVIAAGNDGLFTRLCDVLERPEWARDERFAGNAARVQNREALNAMIAEIVATRPSAHWLEKLEAAGVPAAPMQGVNEVLAHPQTRAL